MVKLDKKKTLRGLRTCGILLFASLMRCISLYVFTVPNKFAPGGVTGLASILYNLPTHIPVGVTIVLLNIPLLVLAFFKMNKTFALQSLAVIVLLSFGVELFGKISAVPQYGIEQNADKMLAALFGGAFTGISLALTFKVNASSGGTDIVGALIQKRYSATNVAWFILMFDLAIAVLGGVLLRDFEPVMYSFVSLFVSSKVSEAITNGFTTAVTFTVITKKAPELGRRIISEIHRGVTAIKSVGLYTGEERTVLQCVVRKRQVSDFHRILKETDKDAFAFAMPATEVLGQGFTQVLNTSVKRGNGGGDADS
ncbi:MAG: YitT family protein [Clostridiales bacterium]|nr:YitT family protein [Clostridiales bacterium]